jgi:translocation and assembly module TamA
VRLGVDRRWVNRKGHKFKADMEYSQRVQGISTQYVIPRPGPDNRSYNFGAAYRDEETDSSRSRMLRLAANDSRDWRGFVRTIGLQYLAGDFEIADERHNSSLLFAEGVLSRKRADDFFFATRGYSLTFAVRGAFETFLADTSFAQVSTDAKWIRGTSEKGRVIVHGGAGAMMVDDFAALPPELRFFAGGDRSVRGFDFEEIGETNASGGVIGGKFLAYAGAEYQHFFVPNWGAAVFADAGDAFNTNFDLNLSVGVGLRWKSPIGMVRLDVAKPVVTELGDGFRIHVIVGPDL